MRLIDADALEDELGIEDEDITFKHIIRNAPTINAIVLPCKVGDTLYEPYPDGTDKFEVTRIKINIITDSGVFELSDIGKSVYVCEQAESALKEGERK